MNGYSLSNSELIKLLSKMDLDSNRISSIEELNSKFTPLLTLNSNSKFEVDNNLLVITKKFNPLPRMVPVTIYNPYVDMSHNFIGKVVTICFLDVLNLILCYNSVYTTRFDAQLIHKLRNLHIVMEFLDYDTYYSRYEKDYLKYASIDPLFKNNLKFKSLVTYIGTKTTA